MTSQYLANMEIMKNVDLLIPSQIGEIDLSIPHLAATLKSKGLRTFLIHSHLKKGHVTIPSRPLTSDTQHRNFPIGIQLVKSLIAGNEQEQVHRFQTRVQSRHVRNVRVVSQWALCITSKESIKRHGRSTRRSWPVISPV